METRTIETINTKAITSACYMTLSGLIIITGTGCTVTPTVTSQVPDIHLIPTVTSTAEVPAIVETINFGYTLPEIDISVEPSWTSEVRVQLNTIWGEVTIINLTEYSIDVSLLEELLNSTGVGIWTKNFEIRLLNISGIKQDPTSEGGVAIGNESDLSGLTVTDERNVIVYLPTGLAQLPDGKLIQYTSQYEDIETLTLGTNEALTIVSLHEIIAHGVRRASGNDFGSDIEGGDEEKYAQWLEREIFKRLNGRSLYK